MALTYVAREDFTLYPTNILGVDQSLSHTAGHHLFDWSDEHARTAKFSIKTKPDAFEHPIERVSHIERRMEEELIAAEKRVGERQGLLVIEGYSLGSKDATAYTLAEVGRVIKAAAWRRGWHVAIVPPTTLKLYTARRGNADKSAMQKEVLKRWHYDPTDDNDADAYALARLGADLLRLFAGVPLDVDAIKALRRVEVHRGLGRTPLEGYIPPPRKPTKREREEIAAARAAERERKKAKRALEKSRAKKQQKQREET